MEQQVPQQPAPQPVPQSQFTPPPTPQDNPGKNLSIVSLVLGIIGLLFACTMVLSYIGIPFAIAALVCGIIGRNKTPEGMKSGMAIAGIVLGAVGIVVALGVLVLGATVLAMLATDPYLMSPELGELLDAIEAY